MVSLLTLEKQKSKQIKKEGNKVTYAHKDKSGRTIYYQGTQNKTRIIKLKRIKKEHI